MYHDENVTKIREMDNNGLPKIICIYPYEEQLTLRCEFFIGLWQDKSSSSLMMYNIYGLPKVP